MIQYVKLLPKIYKDLNVNKTINMVFTSSLQKKLDFCVKLGNENIWNHTIKMGKHFGVNYKESNNLLNDILSNINGIDIIFDCVGANYFQLNLDVINIDGTWVFYGLLSGDFVDKINMRQLLYKRINLIGTTLRTRSIQYKIDLVNDFTENIMPFVKDGVILPVIDRIFSIKNAQDSHEYVINNQNIGKVILSWKDV